MASVFDIEQFCGDFLRKSNIKKRPEANDALVPKFILSEKNIQNLSNNFEKCVRGYHLINDDPIKETPWEDINAQVLNASGCLVDKKSNGSHKPGTDLSCAIGNLSNKSTQYEKNDTAFKISSYRLTTVCSDKIPGTADTIVSEITRRKNFNYYSIIARSEKEKEIRYDWYLIPSDYRQFDPSSYVWVPRIGKTGKNKGVPTGWETNVIDGSSMSITFSMSSQLWLDIFITDDMKKFIISSCTINKGRTLNYIDLYVKETR